MWLDATCTDRYGQPYMIVPRPAERNAGLDCLSEECCDRSSLNQGVEFFSFLRNLTADGFFTSEIGIKYLGYIGNTYLTAFPDVRRCLKPERRIRSPSLIF